MLTGQRDPPEAKPPKLAAGGGLDHPIVPALALVGEEHEVDLHPPRELLVQADPVVHGEVVDVEHAPSTATERAATSPAEGRIRRLCRHAASLVPDVHLVVNQLVVWATDRSSAGRRVGRAYTRHRCAPTARSRPRRSSRCWSIP